jgi:hypothetical protein
MLRPTLTVNKKRIAAQLDRIGGITGLADRWGKRFPDVPDRTTLYDWTKGKRLPGSMENILRLCSCMEMDPMALIQTEGASVASAFDWLLRQSLAGLKPRGIPAAGIVDLFGPRADWPAPGPVAAIFGHGWHHAEFFNQGQQRPFYQRIRLRTSTEASVRTIHFAYRGQTTELWRTYGHVTAEGHTVDLVHYFGPSSSGLSDVNGHIDVETHFGAGACNFRIASLHPFEFKLVMPDAEENQSMEPALRFTA